MLTRGNIEFLRQQVLTSDSAFPLFDESGTYLSDWILQSKMGDAKLIYAGMPDDSWLSAPQGPQLVAIVPADGPIYLTGDRCILLRINELPDGFRFISDRIHELNEKANPALLHYYDNLKLAEDYKPNHYTIWEEARERKLMQSKQDSLDFSVFDTSDAIASLIHRCPVDGRPDLEFNFDGKVKDFCEKNARAWSLHKTRLAEIEAVSSRPDFILPWEQHMADAIRKVGNPKSITIGIGPSDQMLSAKIAPTRLLSILSCQDNLNEWDFINGKKGRNLIQDFRSMVKSEDKPLSCADISTLTFRGKVIYDRAAVDKES